MRLRHISYAEYEGEKSEWRLEGFELKPINLLVGRNASGKSRTLKLITGLALLLTGESKLAFESGHYTAKFTDDRDKPIDYELIYASRKVTFEKLSIDGVVMLSRGEGGVGKIFAEKLNNEMDFQSPDDELAVAARRDNMQHSYLEPLYQWAKNLFFYPFAGDLGQARLAVLVKDPQFRVNPKDPANTVGIYLLGEQKFGTEFTEPIKKDMACLGYPLDDLAVKPPLRITLLDPLPGPLVSLCVKEPTVAADLNQTQLSQGMFRALSIIIQLHYAILASKPSCILIDDIGEGLDFERSCALVKIVRQLVDKSASQLVMSTNDRFVMNAVVLEEWQVLHRHATTCRVYNYDNSKQAFEDFKFTGLNNADLLSTDFLNERRQK